MNYHIMRRLLSQEIEDLETKILETSNEEEKQTLQRELIKRQALFYPAQP